MHGYGWKDGKVGGRWLAGRCWMLDRWMSGWTGGIGESVDRGVVEEMGESLSRLFRTCQWPSWQGSGFKSRLFLFLCALCLSSHTRNLPAFPESRCQWIPHLYPYPAPSPDSQHLLSWECWPPLWTLQGWGQWHGHQCVWSCRPALRRAPCLINALLSPS